MQNLSLSLMKIAMDIGGIKEILKYVFSPVKKSYKTLKENLPLDKLLGEIPNFGKKLQARAEEREIEEREIEEKDNFLIMFAHILGKTIEKLVTGDSKDQERFKIYLDFITDQDNYEPFIRYIVSAENSENLDFSDSV